MRAEIEAAARWQTAHDGLLAKVRELRWAVSRLSPGFDPWAGPEPDGATPPDAASALRLSDAVRLALDRARTLPGAATLPPSALRALDGLCASVEEARAALLAAYSGEGARP